MDELHIGRLGNVMLDEVRRLVQQQTLGHRGHKDDPLYQIRRPPTRRGCGRVRGR